MEWQVKVQCYIPVLVVSMVDFYSVWESISFHQVLILLSIYADCITKVSLP